MTATDKDLRTRQQKEMWRLVMRNNYSRLRQCDRYYLLRLVRFLRNIWHKMLAFSVTSASVGNR